MKSSPKVNFDDFTNDYNQLLKSKTSFFTSNENYFAEHTVNTVRSLITNKPANILEFGCGIGRNIPYLVKCFPNSRIIGSDITSGVLDVAKINNPEIDFFLEPNLDEKLSKFAYYWTFLKNG
jgi:trans-aconitate methyltransferase